VTVTGFEKPIIPAADADYNGYWELQFTAAEGITVTLPYTVTYVGAEPAYTAGRHYVLSFEQHHLSGRYLCAWAEV
jgi:hypothetical protein